MTANPQKTQQDLIYLDDFIKTKCKGPFRLRAVKPRPDREKKRKFNPDTVILVYTSEEVKEEMLDAFGMERLRVIFPVASARMQPNDVTDYGVSLSKSGQILQAIPIHWKALERRERWQPEPVPTKVEMEFAWNGKFWQSSHPTLGALVSLHRDVEVKAASDVKVRFGPGEIALRPSKTSTVWVAGPMNLLKAIKEADLAMYDEETAEREKFKFAPVRQILGVDRSAFELVSKREIEVLVSEPATFEFNAQMIVDRIMRWTSKELLPVLHPDEVNRRWANLARALELANEVRGNIMYLIGWFKEWVAYAAQETAEKRAAGISRIKIHIPKPVGRTAKEYGLIELTGEVIAKRLYQPAERVKPSSTRAAAKKKAEADEQAKPSRRRRPIAQHVVPEERLVATSGEAPTNNLGDRMPKELLAMADKPSKAKRAARTKGAAKKSAPKRKTRRPRKEEEDEG
jgi:hypothetical protein